MKATALEVWAEIKRQIPWLMPDDPDKIAAEWIKEADEKAVAIIAAALNAQDVP